MRWCWGELKRKMRRVLDEEELRLERRVDVPTAGSRVENLRNALEAAKKAKQRLFEKLADRKNERAVFLERKKEYDAEIGKLEQEISDAGMAERIDRDADGEVFSGCEGDDGGNLGAFCEEGAGVSGWEN